MGYFRVFFHRPDFFPPCKLKKRFYKKSFKLLFIKSDGDSVKMIVLGQKKTAGGRQTPPPHPQACLGLKTFYDKE